MNEPYTEGDILAEAISMHECASGGLELSDISMLMEIGKVESTRTEMGVMTWPQLLEDEEAYSEAMEKVRDVYLKRADVSEWAIGLGMDGLKPFSDHIDIQVGPAKARILFAFSEEIDWAQQAEFVELAAFKLAQEM